MIIKSVAFNIDDPDQRAMLEHTKKRPNFSGYIKRLIQRDMEGGEGSVSQAFPKTEKAHVDRELASLLL